MNCSACNGVNVILDNDKGEYYCCDCGSVIESEIIDHQDLSFALDKFGRLKSHSVTSPSMSYGGLGTVISYKLSKDSSIKESVEEKVERNFARAIHSLYVVWGLWQLPSDLRQECSIRYRELIRKGVTNGRNSYAMSIAVSFVVSRDVGIVREWYALSSAVGVNHKKVSKSIDAIMVFYGKKSVDQKLINCIELCIKTFNIAEDIRKDIYNLAESVLENKLERGKKREVVAGAIVYRVISNLGISVNQEDVAKLLGVSERSLRRNLDVVRAIKLE